MTLFEKAVCYAVEKHSGQTRKLSTSPYILHPLEAASIVGTMTDDEATLCAAVLHDTVEDTDATASELRELFGDRVADLVAAETEDKRADLPPESTWRLRKTETLRALRDTTDISVKMMWLGDKLSNIRSIAREYDRSGAALWQYFHQKDPAEHKWYYCTVADYLSELSSHSAYKEYVSLVDKIFNEVKTNEQ